MLGSYRQSFLRLVTSFLEKFLTLRGGLVLAVPGCLATWECSLRIVSDDSLCQTGRTLQNRAAEQRERGKCSFRGLR